MKNLKINSKYILVALSAVLAFCFVALLFSSPENNSEKAMEELSRISEAIHENFRKKPDYWGLNTQYVINNNLLEDNVKGDKLISVSGNDILIGGDYQGAVIMPGSQSFNIIYKDVSRRDCVVLSSYNLDYAEKIGLLSITIINAHETKEFSWGGDNELPISVMQAKNICLNSENTIVWTFK